MPRTRNARIVIIATLVVIVAIGAFYWRYHPRAGSESFHPEYELVLKDYNGTDVRLSQYKREILVVHAWASGAHTVPMSSKTWQHSRINTVSASKYWHRIAQNPSIPQSHSPTHSHLATVLRFCSTQTMRSTRRSAVTRCRKPSLSTTAAKFFSISEDR